MAVFGSAVLLTAASAVAGLAGSKHDLTGGGDAGDPGAACAFCHVPHSTETAATPAWAKRTSGAEPVQFSLYTWNVGPGMKGVNGPGGGSLTCLSCHDGMIAKSVDYPLARSAAASGIPSAFDPRIGRGRGTAHGNEHPIGIPYRAGRAGLADLRDAMEKDIKFYGPEGNQVGCASCHNPHISGTPFSLEKPISDLCSSCHEGKASGRHIMAAYGFGDDHPVKGKPDPLRKGRDLSCTSCHAPHGGPGAAPSISASAQDDSLCLRCHRKTMVRP